MIYEQTTTGEPLNGGQTEFEFQPNVGFQPNNQDTEPVYYDNFELDTGGLISSANVIDINLPVLQLEPGTARIKEESTIVLTLLPTAETNKQILKAVKFGFTTFKFKVNNPMIEEEEPETWEFEEVIVKAVGFDKVSKTPREEPRKTIVELTYKSFTINGEKL